MALLSAMQKASKGANHAATTWVSKSNSHAAAMVWVWLMRKLRAESWMDELPAFTAPRGCPCTAQLICKADERQLFDADCHIPLHGERTYSMHGGAGNLNPPSTAARNM